jgi:methyl-accepting chemotaxis protein
MEASKSQDNTSSLNLVSSPLGADQEFLLHTLMGSYVVLELGLDGTLLNANNTFLKTLNLDQPEVKGRHITFFLDKEYSHGPEFKKLWENLNRGEQISTEQRYIGKTGKDVWFKSTYTPVVGENGRLSKVICLAADISETRSELQTRIDIMNLTSIVSEADLKGDILNTNDKFIEVSKYSKEELIGKGHNTTRHPDMPKEVFKEMWATIGRGKMFRGVVKNRAKDGTPYYVDAVIAPIMGDNGKPRKYLGVRYDITEAEIEKQNMRGVLRAIDSNYGFIEFDINGNVLTANKIFEKVLGYSLSEIKGKQHAMFCEPQFVNSNEYAQFWPDLRSGKTKNGIFKRLNNAGKIVYLQAVYTPVVDETGRVTKVVQIATDVSEQQKMIISLQETANAVSSAAEELTATASQLSSTANKTNEESESAAKAVQKVAMGVQTVATNMEQMVESIKEIGRTTSESSQMTKSTLARAQESNVTVKKLGTSSQEIGDVVKVISSIAQQTNLLALNATIEAARAGEAGKGFAVVANEVKELAKQTAKATDVITEKIGAIQTDTKSAMDAIGGISQAVEKLASMSSVIAAAVEEQTATTNEISRVMIESKKGVESITGTITTVTKAAHESKAGAGQTLVSSRDLAQLAENLNSLVKSVQKA